MATSNKVTPLEENLRKVLQALDTQVQREMQRSPAQEEVHGVQKWEPYRRRIENLSSFVLNSFADQEITLDSLLILSQATAKSLQLLVDDLGSAGLGEVRRQYCIAAFEALNADAERALAALKSDRTLM